MSRETTTTVRWEEIEAGAGDESSLETFAEALIEAAFDDNRIEAIELTPSVDLYGDTEIEVTIAGRISADAFVNEVFDREHGEW